MMDSSQHQFIYDADGKKTFAVIPIEEYEEFLERLEDVEDELLYDQAKREDTGERISLAEMKKRLGLQ
jgi:hypothetical protein